MMVVCTLSHVILVPHTGTSSPEDLQSQSRALHASTQSLVSSGLALMITTSMLSTFMLVHVDYSFRQGSIFCMVHIGIGLPEKALQVGWFPQAIY